VRRQVLTQVIKKVISIVTILYYDATDRPCVRPFVASQSQRSKDFYLKVFCNHFVIAEMRTTATMRWPVRSTAVIHQTHTLNIVVYDGNRTDEISSACVCVCVYSIKLVRYAAIKRGV